MKAVTKRGKKEKELRPFFVILENSIVAAIFTAIIVPDFDISESARPVNLPL